MRICGKCGARMYAIPSGVNKNDGWKCECGGFAYSAHSSNANSARRFTDGAAAYDGNFQFSLDENH